MNKVSGDGSLSLSLSVFHKNQCEVSKPESMDLISRFIESGFMRGAIKGRANLAKERQKGSNQFGIQKSKELIKICTHSHIQNMFK